MSAMQTTKAVATLAGRQSGRSVAASMRGGVSTSGPAVTLRQTGKGNGVVDVSSRGVASKGGDPLKPKTPPLAPADPAVPQPAAAAAAGASEVPPKTKNNNLLIGTVLVGVVGASYYMTMHKMNDQDFLSDVEKEAEEARINLHKSGLKVSDKVKGVSNKVTGEAQDIADAARHSSKSAGEKTSDSAKSAKESAAHSVKSAGEYVSSSAKSAGQKVVASTKAAGNKAADDFDAMAAEAEKELAIAAERNLASGADKAHEVAERAENWGEPKKKGWRKYIFFGPRT